MYQQHENIVKTHEMIWGRVSLWVGRWPKLSHGWPAGQSRRFGQSCRMLLILINTGPELILSQCHVFVLSLSIRKCPPSSASPPDLKIPGQKEIGKNRFPGLLEKILGERARSQGLKTAGSGGAAVLDAERGEGRIRGPGNRGAVLLAFRFSKSLGTNLIPGPEYQAGISP